MIKFTAAPPNLRRNRNNPQNTFRSQVDILPIPLGFFPLHLPCILHCLADKTLLHCLDTFQSCCHLISNTVHPLRRGMPQLGISIHHQQICCPLQILPLLGCKLLLCRQCKDMILRPQCMFQGHIYCLM